LSPVSGSTNVSGEVLAAIAMLFRFAPFCTPMAG
jgi:hypothetical protein